MSLTGILLKGFGSSAAQLDTPLLAIVDHGDGSATATIAGSTAGSTNTLYYQAVDGQLGGSTWIAAGSRTADGTITLTVPGGYYWWYAASVISPDEVVSNMVYQNIASAADPVHWQCLEGVQAVVQSMSLAGVANTSIVVRKLAADRILGALKAGTLGVPLPAVILLPDTEQQDAAQGNNSLDDIVYPVLAMLIMVDNQEPTLAANLPTVLQWRERLNRAFRQQRLAGVSTIIDATVEPHTIVDPQGWAAGYFVSALCIKFTSREPRGFG